MENASVPVPQPVVLGSRRHFDIPHIYDKERIAQIYGSSTIEVASRIDHAVFRALIAKGIGDRSVPTSGEAAGFPVVAAAVHILTGEVLTIGRRMLSVGRFDAIEQLLWGELWHACTQACTTPRELLPRDFRNALLRLFILHSYHPGPERPYELSRFVGWWEGHDYGDPVTDQPHKPIACIRRAVERQGHGAYEQELTAALREGVDAVAPLMPRYLNEACAY